MTAGPLTSGVADSVPIDPIWTAGTAAGYRLLMPPASDDTSPFHLLVVCNANRFRSVLAEHLLRSRARALGLDWAIESAGTNASPGGRLDSAVAAELADRKISTDPGWRSRRIDAALIDRCDLILVAERTQRSAVVESSPAAIRRTYLLAQFGRLASAAAVGTPRSGPDLVVAVRAVQGGLQPVAAQLDTIEDPAGRPKDVLHACADRIAAVVDQILPLDGAAPGEGHVRQALAGPSTREASKTAGNGHREGAGASRLLHP